MSKTPAVSSQAKQPATKPSSSQRSSAAASPSPLHTLPLELASRPQRERALLQMQQRVGNQAVQRFLQPTATAVAIQREETVGLRQVPGLFVVYDIGKEIKKAGAEFNIPPELIGVIVMHESQAVERSIMGPLADIAESVQAALQGNDASIGIGQMKISEAEQLRQRFPQLVNESVVDDLLNKKQAVRYVAAQLKVIKDSLTAFMAAQRVSLSPEQEMDMLALGYNIGWLALRDRNLRDPNFGATMLERVETIRGRSQYLTKTTAYLPLIRVFLAKIK